MISWQWAVIAFFVGVAVTTELMFEFFYNMTLPQFRRYRRISLMVRTTKRLRRSKVCRVHGRDGCVVGTRHCPAHWQRTHRSVEEIESSAPDD
ncbi:hypothetical protein CH300_00160 [Rhodococcus sp. 15-1154-1]|nr:hypothetical protein [Rhodococcus sp. 15-1154-1]OZF09829.1 hypothetical protein CH300_00160 [Rhodococcus sp. 15-1154-1]